MEMTYLSMTWSEPGADEEPGEKSFDDNREGFSSYRDFFAYC